MRWYRDDAWLRHAERQAREIAMAGLGPRWFKGFYGIEPGYPVVCVGGTEVMLPGSANLWARLDATRPTLRELGYI